MSKAPDYEITPEAATRYLLIVGAAATTIMALVWAYTLLYPMAFNDSGYAAWAAKKAMLADCRLGQIDLFGDSRLEAGVVPAGLPVPATNFGLAAGTAIETRVAIDRALACPNLPKQVVISLAPEHFGPLSQFYWLLSLRYHFLSFGDVLAVERLAAQLGDTDSFSTPTPDGLDGTVRDWLYVSGFPSFSFASLVRGRVFGRDADNWDRLAQIERDRGWVAYIDGEPVKAEHPDRFILTKLQNAELEAALAALRDKGVAAAILVMPLATDHQETAATLAAYRDYLVDLSRRTGAVLLDADIPLWPRDAFADDAHFKPEAAHAFTARLAACVKDERLVPPCDLAPP